MNEYSLAKVQWYIFGKHSIASVDISMKSNTFALQNIEEYGKQRRF